MVVNSIKYLKFQARICIEISADGSYVFAPRRRQPVIPHLVKEAEVISSKSKPPQENELGK